MVTSGQVIFIGTFFIIVAIIYTTVAVALARTMRTLNKTGQPGIIDELGKFKP